MDAATTLRVDLPQFVGTVFLSYARDDDAKPPFEESGHGWVTFFWHQLRYELTQAGVARAKLWFDRYEIEPSDDFTIKIEEALKTALVIVPILSPNWVQRPWCVREIERFCELKGTGAGNSIELVVKREPPQYSVPQALQNREGYRFFELNERGKPVEFYWRGLQKKDAYLSLVKQISDNIADRLLMRSRPDPETPVPDPGRRAVFLSVSGDLQDARQRLANDLEHAGFAVLPADGKLPETADQASAAIETMLQRTEMSVHVLGEIETRAMSGGHETPAQLQMRLARARASEPGSAFKRVLWAPKWLPGDPAAKRDPFEVVRQCGGDPADAEVFGEEVTSLSQWLRGRLTPATGSNERNDAVSSVIVGAAGPEDDALVAELANRVQANAVRVHALFHGDPAPTLSPNDTVAVLIPWGRASLTGLDDLLARLTAMTGQRTVLCLPEGDEQSKRRFFRQGVVLEPLAALPSDKQATRALLTDLEILHSPDRSGS